MKKVRLKEPHPTELYGYLFIVSITEILEVLDENENNFFVKTKYGIGIVGKKEDFILVKE